METKLSVPSFPTQKPPVLYHCSFLLPEKEKPSASLIKDQQAPAATPFTVFRVKPGKLSAIQKIQPTPIKSQAPQPNTVSVHTASQTAKKYTDLILL